jgi:hypothetical protein
LEGGGVLDPLAVVKSSTPNDPAEECFEKDDDAESILAGLVLEKA